MQWVFGYLGFIYRQYCTYDDDDDDYNSTYIFFHKTVKAGSVMQRFVRVLLTCRRRQSPSPRCCSRQQRQ